MRSARFTTSVNERGFTLLETILALGLSGLVMLAGYEIYVSYTNKFKQMSDTFETAVDIESGQQIMLRDLKALSPSYTALTIKDDQNHDLFEYFPDVPEKSLPGDPACGGRPCRTYTMKANGGFSEIILLLEDASVCDIPSMVYDPSWAFQVKFTADPYSDADLPVPKGLNNGGAVSTPRPAGGICGAGKLGFWNKGVKGDNGQLLMLDSPQGFRPVGADMTSVQPRTPFFVGQVQGSAFLKPLDGIDPNLLTLKKWGSQQQTEKLLNTKHPLDASKIIDSESNFLLWLPSYGGGQPLVRLRPVKLVKYSVELMYPGPVPPGMSSAEAAKRKGAMRLWKQVYYAGKSWDQIKKFLIAENVKSVQFKRPTVTDKALTFNIAKDELKKGGEN